MIIAALMVLYATYNIKNAKRIKARGGGWKNGLKCLSEDIKNLPMAFMVWRKSYMMKELGERRADRQEAQAARRGRSSPSTDDKTRSRSKSSRRSKSRSKKSKISKGSEKDAAASGTAVDTLDEHSPGLWSHCLISIVDYGVIAWELRYKEDRSMYAYV